MSTPGANNDSVSRQGSLTRTRSRGSKECQRGSLPQRDEVEDAGARRVIGRGQDDDAVRRGGSPAVVGVRPFVAVRMVHRYPSRVKVTVLRVPFNGVVVDRRCDRRKEGRPHHRKEQHGKHGAGAVATGNA